MFFQYFREKVLLTQVLSPCATQVKRGSPAWELLARHNALDMELYEYAVQLFDEQKRLFRMSHDIEEGRRLKRERELKDEPRRALDLDAKSIAREHNAAKLKRLELERPLSNRLKHEEARRHEREQRKAALSIRRRTGGRRRAAQNEGTV